MSPTRRARHARLTLETLGRRDAPAVLAAEHLYGAAADEAGTGVAVVDTGSGFDVYLSGTTTANANDGLALKYQTPYALAGGSRTWATAWPAAAGYDALNAVAATPAGVYAAGASYSRTTDTVGGKEHKGVAVGFPAAGGPASWVRQAPNAPGAFTYGGYETTNDVTAAVEAGQTFLYTTGSSQSNGSNGCGLFLTKTAANGAVLWTRTDSAITTNSDGYDVVVAGGFVYVAGLTNDDGTRRGYVKKYDPAGTLVWARASAPGMFSALVVDPAAGVLYAAGETNGANRDILVEKWDLAGTILWSRTFDRNGAADTANGLALAGGRLYAVGSTRGATAGGSDGLVLEIDPATGTRTDQTLWGGAQDDELRDVAATPGALHVAGTTRSRGNGGSDLAYLAFSTVTNRAPTDVALTPAAVLENQPAGTVVGTLSATDPDVGDTHTFALVAGADDNARFTVVGNELRTAEAFNFEARSNYSVRVRATDAAGLSVEKALAVTVTDVNEAPSFVLGSDTLLVPNNLGAQTVLGWAHGMTNPEAGQALSFEVVSNTNPALFATGPSLSAAGTLTYTVAAGVTGTGTVGVRLRDDGGTANGGVDASPVRTFAVEVIGPNLALNPAATGTPSPTGSDRGWGGGANKWEIADGRRSYDTWAHGLAFTGGDSNWDGQAAGVRQATIDLGQPRRFAEVVAWHHGAEHTPAAANLDYWDGLAWRPIAYSRTLPAGYEPGAGSGLATADRYTFAPVIASKVRWSFDNRMASVTGVPLVHGWLYELEVIGAAGPVVGVVRSPFDTDREAWTVAGDAQGGSGVPDYRPTGGNPGGHVSARDDSQNTTWYWMAPAKYLGDASGNYGKFLQFDLKQSLRTVQYDQDDVILRGAGYSLVADTPVNPLTTWTSYAVKLDETSGWRHRGTATVATEAEVRAVLADLTGLAIRGEYRTGADTGYLDNVVFGGDGPTLTVRDETMTEGHVGPRTVVATVRLSAITNVPVTVNYATADGTATVADSDYQSAAGTLTFAPGETSKAISLTVYGDTKVEANETFTVNLTAPTNGVLLDPTGLVTIVNDDSGAVIGDDDEITRETDGGVR